MDEIERIQCRAGKTVSHRGHHPAGVVCLDNRLRLGQERVQVRRRPGRRDQSQDHPGECGVQSGFMEAEPQQDAQHYIGKGSINLPPVDYYQESGDQGRSREILSERELV